MERQEFLDAIDGLHAYDSGCVDSGIHDEVLRQKVMDFLDKEPDLTLNWLNQYAADLLTSGIGYTLEDIKALIDWLGDRMNYNI